MTTQTIETERIVYAQEFLNQLKNLGIEIPNAFKYRKDKKDEDDGW